MRETAPSHVCDPVAVRLHRTPSPATWRVKAVCMSWPESSSESVAGTKTAEASASDAASLPAE
jgi:hypothetical protein